MLSVDLTKRLGAFELRARLDADAGTLVLFGPSGSGKSLTLSAIAGLLKPDQGCVVAGDDVLFDSRRGIDLPPERRRVGYLPQGYGLFPHLTVSQNVGYGLSAVPRSEARRRVADAVALLRLDGLEERLPSQISGGQAQRVGLARALVIQPRILLLDEPFAALDAEIRRLLRAELVELQRRLGIQVVFVTHDLAEAHAVGDRMAIYDRGEVLQIGAVDAVVDRPRDRRVAGLVATRNVLPGRVLDQSRDGMRVRVGAHDLEAPHHALATGAEVDVCIRPEHVLLIRPEQGPHVAARANVLPARIVREVAQGAFHTLHLRVDPPIVRAADFDLEADVPAHPYEVMGIADQTEWAISLKKSALHVVAAGP